jgi:hypothetical protein
MPQIKPGTRLRSAVCSTEVMVVLAPSREVELSCGGAPMLEAGAEPPPGASLAADAAGGTQLGKRYQSASGDLEVLCTKAGEGSLAADGTALQLKGAKPLPSSD